MATRRRFLGSSAPFSTNCKVVVGVIRLVVLLATTTTHTSIMPLVSSFQLQQLSPQRTISKGSVRSQTQERWHRIHIPKNTQSSAATTSPLSLYAMPDVLASMSSIATTTTTASSFEDILYQIESAASSLASTTLQDPSNLGTALPILYFAGLLTSFSPCVWGLLPLTVSYITTAAGERRDQLTIWPTVAFAAGLAMVFCSLGVAAVEFGQVFGATTGVVGGLVLPLLSNAICLVMGLKLLDMITLPLPSLDFMNPQKQMLQSSSSSSSGGESLILIDATGQILPSSKEATATAAAGSGEGSALVRTFLLGGSSALVASPCATPVLTSILAFVATASNPLLGALLLLCYTLGYATPLLLVAGTGGQALVSLRSRSAGGTGENGGGNAGSNNWYASVLAPWVTPVTGAILLYLGTTGMLTALFGDPSLAGLTILE